MPLAQFWWKSDHCWIPSREEVQPARSVRAKRVVGQIDQLGDGVSGGAVKWPI
jgi:hypothetical protein